MGIHTTTVYYSDTFAGLFQMCCRTSVDIIQMHREAIAVVDRAWATAATSIGLQCLHQKYTDLFNLVILARTPINHDDSSTTIWYHIIKHHIRAPQLQTIEFAPTGSWVIFVQLWTTFGTPEIAVLLGLGAVCCDVAALLQPLHEAPGLMRNQCTKNLS